MNTKNIPLTELIENYLSNLSYINLSFLRSNYIHALAPCIINYNLWSKVHLAAWKQQIEHIDPEHCIGLYVKTHFGKYNSLCNITVINQYKKVDENFFKHPMINEEHSYYCYDIENDNLFKNEKYIKKCDIKSFFKNKITFIRVTTSGCIDGGDYGRKFIEINYKLTKNKDAVCLYKDT